MDDLLIFIRALLVADADLLAAFLAAGGTGVSVVSPDQRVTASYPRIVLSGDEGSQLSYGDGLAKFFNGTVRTEIVTRQSEICPDGLDVLRAIQRRCFQLLLGDPATGLLPMLGRTVSSDWNVTVFRQTNPTRMLPVNDPTFSRHLTTYAVQLNRAV